MAYMILVDLAVGTAGIAQGLTGFGIGIVAMAGLTPIRSNRRSFANLPD